MDDVVEGERSYLVFPGRVEACRACAGWGAYYARYIEGRFLSRCDLCKGAQLVYAGTCEPVGESVRAQFANLNGLKVVPTWASSNMVPLMALPDAGTWGNGLAVPDGGIGRMPDAFL